MSDDSVDKKSVAESPTPEAKAKADRGTVTHSYHDYSEEVEDSDVLLGTAQPNSQVEQSFPVKLHYMLADIEKDGLDHIVSWQVHGRCFLVHNQPLFVKSILPFYFRQSKFASFQRQLNLYGFQRITTGRDKGAYYHECFLRGKPSLATRIQRQKIKGAGARKPASPNDEPKFYTMKPLPSSDFSKYKFANQEVNKTSATSPTLSNLLPDVFAQPPQSGNNLLSVLANRPPANLSPLTQERDSLLTAMGTARPAMGTARPAAAAVSFLSLSNHQPVSSSNCNASRSYEEVLLSLAKNRLEIEQVLQQGSLPANVFTQSAAASGFRGAF